MVWCLTKYATMEYYDNDKNGNIQSISSSGDLLYFTKSNKPENVPKEVKRCVDCPIKQECPYSAVKFYDTNPDWPNTDWN